MDGYYEIHWNVESSLKFVWQPHPQTSKFLAAFLSPRIGILLLIGREEKY